MFLSSYLAEFLAVLETVFLCRHILLDKCLCWHQYCSGLCCSTFLPTRPLNVCVPQNSVYNPLLILPHALHLDNLIHFHDSINVPMIIILKPLFTAQIYLLNSWNINLTTDFTYMFFCASFSPCSKLNSSFILPNQLHFNAPYFNKQLHMDLLLKLKAGSHSWQLYPFSHRKFNFLMFLKCILFSPK